MKARRLVTVVAISVSLGALIVSLHRPPGTRLPQRTDWHAPRVPLVFEPNRGQAPPEIEFIAHASGYSLELSRATATLAVDRGVVRVSPARARRDVAAEGIDGRAGTVNYFIGNDPSRWLTDIATYGQVRYRDLYPGVDLLFRGADQDIEYDFVVHPGADPRRIALTFDGVDAVTVDAAGDLMLHVGRDRPPIRHRSPRAFQIVEGVRRDVDGSFVANGDGTIGFSLGAYDPAYAVTIDPIIVYASALGGGHDGASSIAIDAHGNTYVAGAAGTDFPVTPNAPQRALRAGVDAFVAKIDASGSNLVYATYLGGNNGRQDYESNSEVAWGIAVDPAGNAYVTGQTQSTDFPVVHAFQATAQYNVGKGFDAFIAELNASGSALVFSTYLGSSNGHTYGRAIAVDPAGNAYVAGMTRGSQFPATTRLGPPGMVGPAFVTKFNHAGGVVYSTLLGGSREFTNAYAVAVDGGGHALVAGETLSADFPVERGWQTRCPSLAYESCTAGFLAKLSASGAHLVYSTFLGGAGDVGDGRNVATGVAVDGGGNAFVAGTTPSRAMPTVHAVQASFGGGPRDGFVASFTESGAVRYSTYLGGAGDDIAGALGVDPMGRACVLGSTISPDFPLSHAIAEITPVGPIFRTTDAGDTWTTPTRDFTRPITTIAIDPATPDTMYAAVLYDGIYKSVDGGARWARRSAGLEENLYAQELVVAPSNPATLYLATYTAVYKSANGANAWTSVYTQGSGGALAVDPRTPDTVYVSSAGGGLVKTTDGGQTWRRLSVAAGNVSAIAIDPAAPDTLYAASNGSGPARERTVLKSVDGGESWTNNVLTSNFVDHLLVDPADSNTLYVGGDGVFKSLDAGRSWGRVLGGAGMGVAISGLPQRAVFAATESNGSLCIQRSRDAGATWQRADRGVRRRDGTCGIYALAVDPRRPTRVVAAGTTTPMPFLMRLTAAGRIDYSTYLEEGGSAVVADVEGNAYIAGTRYLSQGGVVLSRFLVEKIAQPQFIHP